MICAKLIETFMLAKTCRKSISNHNFQFSIFNFQLIAAALLLILTSCSGGGDEVSIEGRMLHMNQATFYVYSTDGTIDGIDTITVNGGRFEYSTQINHEGTLVMVFPNYSQVPVFVEPGTNVNIKGDAAHLREMSIEGGKLNELFTEFREKNLDKPVAVMKQVTGDYIRSQECNAEIALWLIQQYFLSPADADADAKGAAALLKVLLQRDADNVKVKRLFNQLNATGTLAVGDKIAPFTATDIDGKHITEKTMGQGRYVVMTCASWSYESQSMLRRLALHSDSNKVVAICLDVRKQDARQLQESCNALEYIMICDSAQWENPLLRTFGLTTVPDNVLIENGKVKRRNIPIGEL